MVIAEGISLIGQGVSRLCKLGAEPRFVAQGHAMPFFRQLLLEATKLNLL